VTEKHSEPIAGLVVSRKQKWRCIYNALAKQALVEVCLRPGVMPSLRSAGCKAVEAHPQNSPYAETGAVVPVRFALILRS
jgi:hypothetical protein